MKTFFNILQTLIDIKEKKYPDEPFNLHIQDNEVYTEIKSHICCLINSIFYAQQKDIKVVPQYTKFSSAKLTSLNTIINNSFYEKQLKEHIIDIFSKAQKHYYSFSKLVRIYKNKKYPSVVTEDLSMNALNPNNKTTFTLIDNKSKYLFSINDLVSIIETAIGNAPNFFSEPLSPLNPYNKQPFTVSTLYNIYFKMKESGRLISVLFHFFFLENFCKYKFSEHYEYYIRENSIKKYVFNSPYTILYNCVFDMLEDNLYTKNYKIHRDFPKEILVNIFRPFLFYYYIIHYDMKGTNKIYNYKQILYNKLKKFYQYNKSFGRRYIQITRSFNKVINKKYVFNTKHINFYNISYDNTYENSYTLPIINMFFNSNNNVISNINNYLLNAFNTSISYIYDSDVSISDMSLQHNNINDTEQYEEQYDNSETSSDVNITPGQLELPENYSDEETDSNS